MLKRYSIAVVVNIILVAFLTIFLGILGFANYRLTSVRTHDALQATGERMVDRLGQSLAAPMWEFEKDRTFDVISQEMLNPAVEAIIAHDTESKEPFSGGSRSESWEVVNLADSYAPADDALKFEAQVAKGSDVMGTVTVYITPRFVEEELSNVMLGTILGIAIADLLIILGLAFAFRRVIVNPLAALEGFARSVEKGDLDCPMPQGNYVGEIHKLRDAFYHMVCGLKDNIEAVTRKEREAFDKAEEAEAARLEVVAKESDLRARGDNMLDAAATLHELSKTTTSTSSELSTLVSDVTKGAESTRHRISEAGTAVSQLSTTIMDVATRSVGAAEKADSAKESADNGAIAVQQITHAVGQVNEHVEALLANMESLENRASGINSVIEVISDIADQTNLLALNAAIEAARAGDAGRGFAVVADEVRKLAEKTMTATKEVSASVIAIQADTNKSMKVTQEVSVAVKDATSNSSATETSFQEIVELSTNTAEQIRSIAQAAEQQSAATKEITTSIDSIQGVADSTTDGMEQAADGLTSLVSLTRELETVVGKLQSL